jgi:outer membrane protein OmpA-like peptidoglycan-associated protein
MKNTADASAVITRRHCGGLLAAICLPGCGGAPKAPQPAANAAPTTPGAGTSAAPVAAPPSAVSAAPAAPRPPTSPPAPPPILPHDQAVLNAATSVLKGAANAMTDPAARQMVVIDPLIDGMTGARTLTSEAMGARLAKLMREQYPQFDVQPFTAANVNKQPLVLVGTFTGVNAQRKTEGAREAYRICFAMLDMKAGKILSKGLAFATPAGVDSSPLPTFRDAPAFTDDPVTLGYIRTCQGTLAGDPINALYVNRILGASQVAEAMEAYDAGRYQQALALYDVAQRGAAADQFRVYNGLYLSNVKLGRREPARAAFRKIVEHGLANQRLAVKFLFKPGAASFADAQGTAAYPDWIRAIADQAAAAKSCLEVVGHTSATGPEPLNERLSQLRAQQLKRQLEARTPALAARTITSGAGSRQMMVGNGRDDASDALDRRVEFKVLAC